MAVSLRQEVIFGALTRPQMFAGVTYSFFILNMIVSAELFLIFKSFWVILAAGILHGSGSLLCLREPRFFDLWMARVRLCPRVPNFKLWRCNSYRP